VSDCQSDKILWGDFILGSNEKNIPITTKHDPVALIISIF